MRGSLFWNDREIRCVHLSAGPESRDIHFARYDLREDVFRDLLSLRDFRLFVPGSGGLEFSGYHPLEGRQYEAVTVVFFPSAAGLCHDSWTVKIAGREGGNRG